MSVIAHDTPTTRSAAGRSRVGMGLWRARFELAQYVRSGDTLVFTFLFPILMLGLFSVAFGAGGEQSEAIERRASYFTFSLPLGNSAPP